MSKKGAKTNSLEFRTIKTMVITCGVTGLFLLILGLGLYTYSLAQKYVEHAIYISKVASIMVSRDADVVGFSNEVMDRYHELSPEQLQMNGSQEYRDLFSEQINNSTYQSLVDLLKGYLNSDEVFDVYIAMYDVQNCHIVYIVDPDPEGMLFPGEWEPVEEEGARRFLDYSGHGMLYDIDNTEKYGLMCTAGEPIYDADGNMCAFVLVDVTTDNLWIGIRSFVLQMSLMMVLLILLLILLIERRIKTNLVDPINKISDSAKNYTYDRLNGVTDVEHFASLDIQSGDEIEELASTMADMEKEMNNYADNLAVVTAEKERIGTELSWANRIQESMLPHVFPAFPDRKEFEIYASMTPAKEVGGDFYDFFLVDDDHLCMVIADVSGKGVPAALFMMAARIVIANYAMMGNAPSDILKAANSAICANNREEMFISVWIGILEISTGKLTASNAGHEYPVIRSNSGVFTTYRDRHSLVVGAMENTRYYDYELNLSSGDKLFVYTDGIPEATNRSGKLMGEDRMIDALNTSPDSSPDLIIDNVKEAVNRFADGAEQFDDMTMLCLDYKGSI